MVDYHDEKAHYLEDSKIGVVIPGLVNEVENYQVVIDQFQKTLIRMEERLSPLLMPALTKGDSEERGVRDPGGDSQLVQTLRTNRERTMEYLNNLNGLLNRVQI